MTFVNDEGEVLDFDGFFALTKRSVSFFNSRIQGDYSINFSVDNNSKTRKFLNYDGPQMLNQVAFTRQSVTAVRNGNPLARGYIVIQSDNGDTLSCYFISGNSNWVNLVQGLITELDYSGVTNAVNYELELTGANILATRSATSGIIFPMVDWVYDLRKGDNSWYGVNLLDISVDDMVRRFFEWYPCFYLHTLISEIGKQKGLKITGNVLNNNLYKTMVLTPVNGELKRKQVYRITTAYTAGGNTNATGSLVRYTSLTEAADPEGIFSSGVYTANKSSKIIVTVNVRSFIIGAPATTGTVQLRKNGVSIGTFVQVNQTAGYGVGTYIIETSGVSGDTFDVAFVRDGGAGSMTVSLDEKYDIPTLITYGDYIRPDWFLPELSCLDVIKFVINFFGCSVYFDEYSKTLTINQIEGLKPEDAEDWSEYFQSVKIDYTINGAANNYLRLADADDTEIKAYNKNHFLKYGEGNITSGNTLKEKADILKIPFAASEFGLSKNGTWLTNIPLIRLEDAGDPIAYTGINNSGGSAAFVFDALADTFLQGQVCRIVDDTNGDLGIWTVINAAFTGGTATEIEIAFYGFSYPGATSTGKIYLQQYTPRQINPRILVVKPSTPIADFGSDSEYDYHTPIGTTSAETTAAFAHFSKPQIGDVIDTYKSNLAIDNPDLDLYSDPTVKQLNFGKISRLIGNPTPTAVFLLPEAVYQSFEFGGFIYLKTKDLTGYFWVESISNYIDSSTKTQVPLLML